MHFLQRLWATVYGLAIAAIVISCATNPPITPEEIATADFGQLPENYQQDIANLMSRTLKDPASALYRFETPRRGFAQEGAPAGGKRVFGYIVPTWINAKNSFGGYVGEKRYFFLFVRGSVQDVTGFVKIGAVKFVE